MAQSTIESDVFVNGNLGATSFTLGSGDVEDLNVAAGANIAATKLIHRHQVGGELFAPATTITALTKLLPIIMRGSGTLKAVEAYVITAASGADRTVTVDLQRSTGAAVFTSVLSASIGFTNVSVARTPVAGTLSSTALVDNDLLQLVVSVAGSAGAQALGLCVVVTLEENGTG